ncbi:unnamed protein product [Rhizophagus irregularis]|nr:unnamed protein product [Rhizophagus irregularis]
MEEGSSKDTQNSEFTHGMYSLGLGLRLGLDDCSNISNETILSYENNHILLYSERKDEISDKENFDSSTLILRNLKKKCGKGRPLSTKRFKSSTEATKPSQEIIDIAENVERLATIKKNCKVHN